MNDPMPNSFRGGWLIRGVLIVAVLGVILAAAWIVLLPGIVVSTIQARTGFVVKVEQMSVNPFIGKVNIEGAVVENPIGWPTHEFITLRHFKVAADLLPLLRHRFVADEMTVDVESFFLVRNQDGVLNTEAFRKGLAKAKGDTSKSEQPKEESQKTEFLIHHLSLKFDRLVMADYSGRKPSIKEYNLKISQEMREVDSVTKLIIPFNGVVLDAIGKMFDFVPVSVGGTLNSLEQAGKKTGESLKKLFQSLEKKKP